MHIVAVSVVFRSDCEVGEDGMMVLLPRFGLLKAWGNQLRGFLLDVSNHWDRANKISSHVNETKISEVYAQVGNANIPDLASLFCLLQCLVGGKPTLGTRVRIVN